MKRVYVYEITTLAHVATIICETEDECEIQANALFGLEDEFAWKYSARFGKPGGLKLNSYAVFLDYRVVEKSTSQDAEFLNDFNVQ